jgi:ethanolamine utilization microcompartment shell protein EutS
MTQTPQNTRAIAKTAIDDLETHLGRTDRLASALALGCEQAAVEMGHSSYGLMELAELIQERVQEARQMLDAATSRSGEGEPGRVTSASATG